MKERINEHPQFFLKANDALHLELRNKTICNKRLRIKSSGIISCLSVSHCDAIEFVLVYM